MKRHAEEAEDVANMPRTLRSMPRRSRTLPSMPRSCQASLHILGSHKYNLGLKISLVNTRRLFAIMWQR